MRYSSLGRKQKLVLGVIVLALIAVLVLLAVLIQQQTSQTSPATIVLSVDGTVTPRATTPRPTTTTAVRVSPTPVAVADPPTPTLSRPAVTGEVLAARRIETLTRGLEQVRELPKQQEIPLNFLSDQEIAGYLRRILADVERQVFVKRQQTLLAALNLSPNLGQAFPPTVQTRVNHLIAFYSPAEEQIFIRAAEREKNPPDDSLIHQYAHALIDQHFNLSSLNGGAPNADAARARDALIEGDALAVLLMQRFKGIDPSDQVADELAAHLSEAELTDYEGYLVSRAMQDVFVFPYREGARFVSALLQAGWWRAVNAAYIDPPVSTEQILHPEKYLGDPRDEPRAVFLPNLGAELDAGWRLAVQDVMGELILRAHLDQYLPDTLEAQVAAAGWDGDLAAVWQDGEGREVLVMRTLWDSEDEANEFVGSYITLIDRRLQDARRVLRPIVPRRARWWRGEGSDAYLQQEGSAVLILWAPDTDTMERVLSVFVLDGE